MRYSTIPVSLFIKNREKLKKELQANSLAIVHAQDQMPRNGDLFYPYRQSSDFFYLTGIEQEKSIFVLFPDCNESQYTEALFIIRPEERLEIWEGKKLTIDEASQISGIQNVYYLDEFAQIFRHLAIHTDCIYLNKNENERFSSPILSRDEREGKIIQEQFSLCSFKRLAPLLEKLRMIKEPEEIDLMSTACSITRNSYFDVLRNVKPGMYEFEVEAIVTQSFIRQGASGHAYDPIIASGINSCYLHYNKNDKKMLDGEILFMDFGAEYANYSSDCSRAIPVNGKFSVRQLEIYTAVLNVFNFAKQLLVPGTTIKQYHTEVCKYMESELIRIKLLTPEDIKKQDPRNPAFRKYFMHGTSHYMGLDTHDVGSKDMVLQPGMVVSCEPGIYILEEQLGIRLENDFLITNTQPIDLMADIPLLPHEIEDIMASKQ